MGINIFFWLFSAKSLTFPEVVSLAFEDVAQWDLASRMCKGDQCRSLGVLYFCCFCVLTSKGAMLIWSPSVLLTDWAVFAINMPNILCAFLRNGRYGTMAGLRQKTMLGLAKDAERKTATQPHSQFWTLLGT